MDDLLENALKADNESESIDFKRSFDVSSAKEWCELIKDIVAMANSGGGVILFGLEDDGSPSGCDLKPILNTDYADFTNKIYKYSDYQFSEFEIKLVSKSGAEIVALIIHRVHIPIIFTSPGTYPVEGNKQRTSFGVGTIYFRHGAKSEPGNTHDLRKALERELESTRELWLSGIKKVVEAPQGSQVTILPPHIRESNAPTAIPIRIVDDPSAPSYRSLDPNVSHPHRQKEVIKNVNEKLEGKKINDFDIQCVRKVHKTDNDPKFYYRMNFSSPRYSDAFVDWLVEQHQKDNQFFESARARYRGQK